MCCVVRPVVRRLQGHQHVQQPPGRYTAFVHRELLRPHVSASRGQRNALCFSGSGAWVALCGGLVSADSPTACWHRLLTLGGTNNIGGTIPSTITQLSNLVFLYLAGYATRCMCCLCLPSRVP